MSKNSAFGQGLKMAALDKTGGGPVDLMRPGNGTPWEDRGSTGAIGAYFKTVIKTMFSPGLLMDHIRRPETTSDSTSFAIISCAMWIISVFAYKAYWLQFVLLTLPKEYEKDVDPMWYWLTTALEAALVGIGLFLWLRVGPKIYSSLGATELKGANPALLQNCFNYAMGPSIFALVPIYGWALATVWILFVLMITGKQRLFLRGVSAVINVLILFAAVALSTVVVWLLLTYLWEGYFGNDGLARITPPPPIKIPTRD